MNYERSWLYFADNRDSSYDRINRGASANANSRWDFGVIPYTIDATANFTLKQKALFRTAMRQWEAKTCLQFVPRNIVDHPNYVTFLKDPKCGCCSFIGNIRNGPQVSNIFKSELCYK